MYSDGITEAWSNIGEQYGEERLVGMVRAHRSDAPAALVEFIVADVRRFSPQERSDDWTLIAARARVD